MKIYLDISHPAQVHALSPFMQEMKDKGHFLLITARDKDITHALLTAKGFSFIDRGKGKGRLCGKILYALQTLASLYPVVSKYKPDLFVSYSSYFCAILAFFCRKPCITFEDTEPVPLLHWANRFFSTYMVTPACFNGDFSAKHIRFNGYKELAFLHPARFTPDSFYVLPQPYLILRLVSWQAYHDRGHKGISPGMKQEIVQRLSAFGKVFLTSEQERKSIPSASPLPVPVHRVHDLLSGARLFIGESASMAAEAAVLGVPAIYIDDTGRGYTRELEEKYGLLYRFGESDQEVRRALHKAIWLLQKPGLSRAWQEKRQRMLEEKIDVTGFMVGLVEKLTR